MMARRAPDYLFRSTVAAGRWHYFSVGSGKYCAAGCPEISDIADFIVKCLATIISKTPIFAGSSREVMTSLTGGMHLLRRRWRFHTVTGYLPGKEAWKAMCWPS